MDSPPDLVGRLADFLQVCAVVAPQVTGVGDGGGAPVKYVDGPLRRAVLVLQVSILFPVGIAQGELRQEAVEQPPGLLDATLRQENEASNCALQGASPSPRERAVARGSGLQQLAYKGRAIHEFISKYFLPCSEKLPRACNAGGSRFTQ